MKSFFTFLLCFLLLEFCFGQETESLKDGYQIFKYPNGSISSEGLIKGGKPEGFWKSYYVTGVKKSEGKRTNFLLDSIWVFYDQTGDTIEKISFMGGKKNGYYLRYKKDAANGLYIWSKELFAGDKKEGKEFIYFPDGKIQQIIGYTSGKKEGLSKEFSKDGNVITLLEYNNDYLVSREKINRKDGQGLKQGEWKEFYPNGGIKSEKTFKDDLIHGYYKEYDTKGKLVLTMLYDNGAIVKSRVEDEPDIEIVTRHDEDGKVVYSGPYRNKIPVGIHREFGKDGKVTNGFIYNDNGLLLSEGIIDESGNRNGKWKDLFVNGKIQDEGQFTDNKRSGQWKFYNALGKVEQTGSYNQGRPDGSWKWYYDDGVLLKEEEYFQGQRDGQSTEYSEKGEIIAQGEYTDGERNGDWKFKAGDYLEEGKYIIGLKDGIWKAYYENESLQFKGNFVQGNPDGMQTFYFENGKIKEEQYFQMGIREKIWKKFNEDGTPEVIIAYRNDTEVSINGMKIKLPESETKLIK
jgi:uncharacterized protein